MALINPQFLTQQTDICLPVSKHVSLGRTWLGAWFHRTTCHRWGAGMLGWDQLGYATHNLFPACHLPRLPCCGHVTCVSCLRLVLGSWSRACLPGWVSNTHSLCGQRSSGSRDQLRNADPYRCLRPFSEEAVTDGLNLIYLVS